MMRRRLPAAALTLTLPLILAASLLGSDASSREVKPTRTARKATPTPAPPANSCTTCIERRPTLEPALFADTRIYEAEARPAYEVARKIPATLDRLHCFCECAESLQFHHKTLLTCFTDRHAGGCGICIKEALLASELKQKGASDDEVVHLVESMFRTEGHPPTHVR